MRISLPLLLAGLLASGASLFAQPQPTPPKQAEQPGNQGSKVGVNLADFTYYSTEVVFADLFKGCSEWIPQLVTGGPWNTGQPFPQRADGYPASLANNQAVATLLMSGVSRYPGGVYVVLWDGDGDVEVRWDANERRRTSNRLECFVRPADGILLRIVRTNAADPVRNIRFVGAEDEDSYRVQPLHRTFLNNWGIAKTLRFMDWQRTNSTYHSAWTDRVAPDYYTQAGDDGASAELLIDVCNGLNADGWFCMPHLCTDDYVRQFARVVRSRLRPGLKAYVEYSNECWNGSFVQARYCREMGVHLNLSSDPFEAQLRYYSQRSVEVFRIWEQELGRARIVRTLAGQNVNTWSTRVILDWQNAHQNADAWAVNAYFGHALGDPVNQIRVQNMTPEAILAECAQDIVPAMAFCAQQKAEAQARGLELVAFEAGQHMVGFGSAAQNQLLADKLIAANRLPAMRQVYDVFLSEWRRVGGGMVCLFNSTSRYGLYGSWGMFEDSLQAMRLAPKYLGVMDYVVRTRNLP
jgi:hypothetical protein